MNVRDFPIDTSALSDVDCRRFPEEIECAMDLHSFLAKLKLRITSCGEMSVGDCLSGMVIPRSTDSDRSFEERQPEIKEAIRLSYNMKSSLRCCPNARRITLECSFNGGECNRLRGKLIFHIYRKRVEMIFEPGCLVEIPAEV